MQSCPTIATCFSRFSLPHRIHRAQPARIRSCRRNQNMLVLGMPLQKVRDQLLTWSRIPRPSIRSTNTYNPAGLDAPALTPSNAPVILLCTN